MVAARYGTKNAILDAFLHEYVRRLNPDPSPRDDGLTQVLAHFDRIDDLYRTDREVLRAMFVATFEAVKTTSPLRDRVIAQMHEGATKVETALRTGIADGSIRRDTDVATAGDDITAAVFGVGFHWVVLPHHDLEAALAGVRARIIRDYAGRPAPAARSRRGRPR
ncbi:MAG: transcriptional regulator [Mycobacterium sp.]|nr:transcriptional regulator [Mycobacterium sp.]